MTPKRSPVAVFTGHGASKLPRTNGQPHNTDRAGGATLCVVVVARVQEEAPRR